MKYHNLFAISQTAAAPAGLLSALSLALFVGVAGIQRSRAESVVGSKHDLSVNGPGPIKANTEKGVCIFCHTPHGASTDGPLWNRFASNASYTPYSSTTAKAHPGQPTGASKLCLSCHDGTVALGMVRSRTQELTFSSGIRKLPAGRSNLGTDLSDDHPVSFIYDKKLADSNGQLRDPAELTGVVHLDRNNELQCTACHDPHNNHYGKFLRMNNTASALCNVCHNQTYWTYSSHRISTKSWDGVSTAPWPHTIETTVAANGCENCHAPHSAGTKQRLLNFALEEDNCYSCHNGHVATRDIQSEFGKLSVHPITQTHGVHDPYGEYQVDPVNSPRHVTCVDCHNPHAVKSAPTTAPFASGALAGVTGINSAGNTVTPVAMQYEVCFRCHADSLARGSARVIRQNEQTNTRLEFSGLYTSYHPVVVAGKNSSVPSLIAPLTTSGKIYCTDCHNNDQGPGAGGSGPNGPHGSAYIPLLEREQVLTDFIPEGPDTYALCYKCHNRTSILNDESFKFHKKHIVDVQTACTTCHDSHAAQNTTHLINFNTQYVSPSPTNMKLEYVDQGAFNENCSLMCHGKDHVELATQTNSIATPFNMQMLSNKRSKKR